MIKVMRATVGPRPCTPLDIPMPAGRRFQGHQYSTTSVGKHPLAHGAYPYFPYLKSPTILFTNVKMVHSNGLAGFALVLAATPLASADATTVINAASNRGAWEGWGTSLAWWAKQFGNRDDLADAFSALKSTGVNSQTLTGLGFNTVRYDAAASARKPVWQNEYGDSIQG